MPNPTVREICITAAYTLGQGGPNASGLDTPGPNTPGLDARVLVAHALGLSRLEMIMQSEREVTPEEQREIHTLINRRALGEPVALIVGCKEFYGRDFVVKPETLVPRPDTESLIEYVLAHESLGAREELLFLDLGTGSGCIAVTLCCERPAWQACMVDISAGALAVACTNAEALGVRKRCMPLRADMTKLCFKNHIVDLIISNPPYVSDAEYHELPAEIRHFEPRNALQPAAFGVGMSFELTGLGHIDALAHCAHRCLKPGGSIVVEHGYQQGLAVRELFSQCPEWEYIATHQDLAGKDRFCTARKALI